MLCPRCRRLAPLSSSQFTLKSDPFRPDRTKYIHENCRHPGKPPTVIPARFIVACTRGHLDDFPWLNSFMAGRRNAPTSYSCWSWDLPVKRPMYTSNVKPVASPGRCRMRFAIA